ncbi:MAG: DUF1343 domain-containing protein [Deltaproteobacteria bacterium]|nr:DUF1343 domain-containing protein [Deltaproteobacteria bacterium]
MSRVLTGADRLAAEGAARLRGQRVGLVCNQSTVIHPSLEHLADLLHAAQGVELAALFAPEHGLRGEAQDMESVGSTRDPVTGLPVHSLYGSDEDSLAPRAEDLEGLDRLVFDVQDIGTRYYTFAATLLLCMRRAAPLGLPVLVLDRPNPLGGGQVRGGTVAPGFESFVGLYPVPVRHGLSVGELALWLQRELVPECELEVLFCEGWRRADYFDATGLTFVPPSPNMPTLDTAIVYPGQCLIEGTELSEGRGTTRPFELFGAPGLDGHRLHAALRSEGGPAGRATLEGAVLREASFRPMFQKHAGRTCGGLFLHVTDRERFDPFRFGLHLIHTVATCFPEVFAWREKAYEFVEEIPAIDLLTGSAAFREAVEAGRALDAIFAEQEEAEAAFRSAREAFLHYS